MTSKKFCDFDGMALVSATPISYLKLQEKEHVQNDLSKLQIPPCWPKLINGEMEISFIDTNMEKVDEDVKLALILKFSVRRPPIDLMWLHINMSWGFLDSLIVNFMDKQPVLLDLASEKDYLHAWAREGRMVARCCFSLFNWTVDFDA